ncbi:MAG TPA: ABC transporter permease [Candidatus Acidoferrum sp.]|nr:ABC transporter permease [Candidatus Acidoferrum sp.]
MPFELGLALRYLRPKRTFVSVITLISILGVMLGVAVLMIVIAVMSGFDREWRERILSFNAHLKIVHRSGLMADWRGPMGLIESNQYVKGVAPFILTQVMLQTQPDNTNDLPKIYGPGLRGIDPELESNVSILPRSVIAGEYELSGHGMLMGAELARELGLHVGDHVDIISAHSLAEYRKMKPGSNEAVVPDDYEVRGVFDVGFNDFNRMLIVTSLRNAQQLQNIRGHVHGLYVMLHDAFQFEQARAQIRQQLGPEYEIVSWTEENATIFGALATEKTMMYIILFVVMVVAAFAIVNSEITFAVNKMKEIGLLKSLGAADRQVMIIFLGHSIAVGVLGVGLGVALGLLFLFNLNNILHAARSWTGFELLPAAIYQITEVPFELLPWDMGVICGGSFLICVLAGLLPAWKASRLLPVEALRND